MPQSAVCNFKNKNPRPAPSSCSARFISRPPVRALPPRLPDTPTDNALSRLRRRSRHATKTNPRQRVPGAVRYTWRPRCVLCKQTKVTPNAEELLGVGARLERKMDSPGGPRCRPDARGRTRALNSPFSPRVCGAGTAASGWGLPPSEASNAVLRHYVARSRRLGNRVRGRPGCGDGVRAALAMASSAIDTIRGARTWLATWW